MTASTSKFINLTNLDDDSDGDQGDKNQPKFIATANATLFLVDGRKNMFDGVYMNEDEETTAITLAFKCIVSCLRNKIYTNENSYCGVGLVGADKTDNGLNLKNIMMLSPLAKLGADQIKSCLNIVEDISTEGKYDKKYGSGNINVADLFLFSSRTFSEAMKTVRSNKTIILFTNDDDPHGSQPDEKRRAIINAKDLSQHYIDLDIIQMGNDFKMDLFYKEILQDIKGDTNLKIPDPVTKMAQMFERVTKINYRKVPMVKLPLIVSDEFQIGVTVHQLVRKVKPPFKIKLSKATNEPVSTKLQLFQETTGDVIEPENVIKYETIGGEEISFKPRELNEIKDTGERGFKLVGFKPTNTVQLDHFIQPSAFIYPDENYCKGSKTFFTALLKRCKAKDKVAICTYYPRPMSTVRFVALVPHEELADEDNMQISPSGFIVVFLPFADEVRYLDDKCCGKKRASSEQVDIARKIVKKLTFKYTPSCFSNPKIRKHWAAIDALALDLTEPEEVTDNTVLDYDLISKRLKTLVSDFTNEVYGEEYDPEVGAAPAKRQKLAPAEKATPKERAKPAEPAIDVKYIEELATNNELTKLKVDQLRSYLSSVGVKGISKMKKTDMIDVINKRLGITEDD